MQEFDLVSVDWETVRLMQSGQLKQETYYLEELVRWTLQRGRLYGLLHLADNGLSRPSPEGQQAYSVSLRGCYAVGPQGYLIEIPDDPRLSIQGIIEARSSNLVPLYVGVSKVERDEEPALRPTVDTGLLQCGGRRAHYELASDASDASLDWLQIAQFEKTSGGLVPVADYVPECMFLSSHGGLWQKQQEVSSLARRCLEILRLHSSDSPAVYGAALALAGSLGPASRVLDSRLHPFAYLDRLAGVLQAQHTQLLALPNPNLTRFQETTDAIADVLAYLESEWTTGAALRKACDCFERLLGLYPELLPKLGATGPEPRQRLDHDIVVPVPEMPGAAPPKRTFWRK